MIESINKELMRFSAVGLRTLVLAKRVIEPSEYEAWDKEYAVIKENFIQSLKLLFSKRALRSIIERRK